MELKNSISIGPDYLQNKVKAQYSDHRKALVREFLQNSIDAGSKNIWFLFDSKEGTLTVDDDGCGMSDDIMTKYLFRLGGSLKETISKSTGGFGAAKLILLFQHESFQITSYRDGNRYEVHGVADRYSDFTIVPDTSRKGTIIKIKFLSNYFMEGSNDRKNMFEYYSRQYIASCQFSCNVFWNEDQLCGYEKGDLFKTLEWGQFYHRPAKDSISNYVKIRINGLTMFEVYVSKMKAEVTVELTKNSLEILTENRDSFKYSYQKELYAIIGEFNVDKESFARLQGKMFTYHGQNGTTFSDHCVKTVNRFKNLVIERLKLRADQMGDIGNTEGKNKLLAIIQNVKDGFTESLREQVDEILNTVQIQGATPEISKEGMVKVIEAMVMKAKIMGVEKIEEIDSFKDDVLNSMTSHDFVVKVDKAMDKIPANMDPKKGLSPKYYKLAQVWCHAIKTLAFMTDRKVNFRIGWVFDDKAEAMCIGDDNGICFLINPELKKWWELDSKVNNLKRLARVAAHEFTHYLGVSYHDETFCLKYDELIDKLDLITNWKAFESDAYEETV